MSTATPGYATNAQMKQAARIRAAYKRGAPVHVIAYDTGLDGALVRRMVNCHTVAGAAKVLAEYITRCKENNAAVSI